MVKVRASSCVTARRVSWPAGAASAGGLRECGASSRLAIATPGAMIRARRDIVIVVLQRALSALARWATAPDGDFRHVGYCAPLPTLRRSKNGSAEWWARAPIELFALCA